MTHAPSAIASRPLTLADRLLGPTRPASIDRLRTTSSVPAQIAGIVGFALLASLAAQAKVLPQGWAVPITLQTLVVYSAGLWLGARNGSLSMLLYLLAGLVLPVYSGGGEGWQHLAGATGGYLIAYPFAPLAAGLATRRFNGPVGVYLSLLASSATLFSIGVTWLWAFTDLTFTQAVWQGWAVFVLIDLLKLLVVAIAYSGSRYATRQ